MAASKAAVSKTRAATSAMGEFTWGGTDKRGIKMRGETLAKNANLLRAELRKQGINPTIVKPKTKPFFGSAGAAIKPKDIAIFSRQIATMMQSGVPMVQAFEIIGTGQKNPKMKDMILGVKAEIEGGSSLSEALAKYPLYFDSLYRNLVKAGEGA